MRALAFRPRQCGDLRRPARGGGRVNRILSLVTMIWRRPDPGSTIFRAMSNRSVRFSATVAMGHATCATKRTLPTGTCADVATHRPHRSVFCRPARGVINQTSRLVKKRSVIFSVTDGSSSSEVMTVTNSFLQSQQRQRSWISCALTRSCHWRWIAPDPHRGHFS
jgi:hypothetical protein